NDPSTLIYHHSIRSGNTLHQPFRFSVGNTALRFKINESLLKGLHLTRRKEPIEPLPGHTKPTGLLHGESPATRALIFVRTERPESPTEINDMSASASIVFNAMVALDQEIADRPADRISPSTDS